MHARHRRKSVVVLGSLVVLAAAARPLSGAVIGFEEFAAPPWSLGPESYYNGADGAGGFASGGAAFNNTFVDYGGGFTFWSGWAVSNVTDTTTPGYENQFAAFPGSGADGSAFYGVASVSAFDPLPTITLPAGAVPQSVRITNTTYAALSMLYGDQFATQFGGSTGTDPDWFRLTITGLDAAAAPVGSIEFYLADYRFADSQLDYILDEWTLVDLTPLAGARALTLNLASSDNGAWGMNTPAYFALDELLYAPEPATVVVLLALAAARRRCP